MIKKLWCSHPVFLVGLMCSPVAYGQWAGVNAQGSTGGLVIPSADVLPRGAMSLSYGNSQEPQLGSHSIQQNMSLGIGILPNVELFGRFTDYNTPVPGSIFVNGVRDLSANVKVALPIPAGTGLKVAVGVNDVAGGAAYFKSSYVVGSASYKWLDASLGYAQGKATANQPTFNGAFGGLAVHLGNSGLAALVESDGQQKHAGLRWSSEPLESFGGGQILGTLQRSFGAQFPDGRDANATNLALAFVIPLGGDQRKLAAMLQDSEKTIEVPNPTGKSTGMEPTVEDRLLSLRNVLVSAGFERVRVGQQAGSSGKLLVIELENHRFAQNEVDAVGLALGLAVEGAPPAFNRVKVIGLKEGMPIYETSVGIEAFRAFLRGNSANDVRDSLVFERGSKAAPADVAWIEPDPTSNSRIRFEIKPELAYTLGTEVGVFDYSLAANLQAVAPLWRGARLYSSYVQPIDNSVNMNQGNAYDYLRQRQGVKSMALQQSVWLGNHVLASAAAGQFYYDRMGVQAESSIFVPGSDDVVRFRGAAYDKALGGIFGQDRAYAASYRRMLGSSMSIEVGAQRFSDGTSGPSVEWTQWFGDVSLQLFYRKGGDQQFAGLQISLPLTPRRGMMPGNASISGTSRYAQSIRTFITNPDQPANLVLPGAVRDLQLDTSLETDLFNSGRLSQRYFEDQLPRMRQSFLLYSKESTR